MKKRGRPKGHTQTDYSNKDWHHIPTDRNPSKKYLLEQQIERCDRQDIRLLSMSHEQKEPVVMNKIYGYVKGKWIMMGYRCTSCDKTYKNPNIITKHKDVCKRINTKNKEIEFMPIQKITKNGKTYYRYGDTGKLYPTKEEAEKQMRAMYAAGYKGSSEKKDAKN